MPMRKRFYCGHSVTNTTDKTVRFYTAVQHLGRSMRPVRVVEN